MNGGSKTLAWTLGVAGALVALAALTPRAFRGMEAFTIERVEVTGARYLSAAQAMAAAGITRHSNVFDDAGLWEEGLRRHALVLDVRVERRPPSVLRFHVVEAVPVALLRSPLRPVDARGRVLPIDPTGQDLDLPLLAAGIRPGPDSLLDARGHRVIETLVTLMTLDRDFAADVSELAPVQGGGVRLILTQPPGTELLLPDEPDARILHQLRLALDHIRQHDAPDSTRRAPAPVRIDARFPDELFVTMPERRTS